MAVALDPTGADPQIHPEDPGGDMTPATPRPVETPEVDITSTAGHPGSSIRSGRPVVTGPARA